MKRGSAMLVGLGSVETLANALSSILEPHFDVHLHFRSAGLDADEAQLLVGEVSNTIHRFDSSIILLVLDTDLYSEGVLVFEALRSISSVPITVVFEKCDPDQVLEFLNSGAAEFISSPLKAAEVLPRIWRLINQSSPSRDLIINLKSEFGLKQLVGQSPGFRLQVEKIPLIAACDANVLVGGETGTGKEIYARAIHYCSARSSGPFVPVNCGAIPVELVENELFGHQRGAFTGAMSLQKGVIEEASGGTLFLDEIDCLPPLAQVKLLRFLQEKEYRPLGSPTMKRADVRVIAASNLNLEEATAQGKLRLDLYYRLNIISLALLPLRERREDIPLLVRHFVRKYSTEFNKKEVELSDDALHTLMTYEWPGNVRELEHIIERAVVMSQSSVLHAKDLHLPLSHVGRARQSLKQAKAKEIARFEKNYLCALLSVCNGNITRAAQIAQKNRRAFWQLLQKYQIEVAAYRSNAR